MTEPKISIDFYPDGTIECTHQAKNGTEFKALADASLMQKLCGNSLRHESKYVTFYDYPKNMLALSVLDENTFKVALYVPKRRFPFTYKGSGMKQAVVIDIEYPEMIHIFNVKDGSFRGSHVYCLASEYAGDTSMQVYKFPFGNVHDTGSVCWGSVRSDFFNDIALKDTEDLYSVFLASTFNNDLTKNDVFLLAKQCVEQFDVTILEPYENIHTVSDVLKAI